MADLAASNVSYSVQNLRRKGDCRNSNRVQVSFGDGALTYPAGGVPLTKGHLGCPVTIESLIVVDKGASGYNFMYDQSAEKLLVFQTDQIDDPEEEATGVALAAQVLEVEVIGS